MIFYIIINYTCEFINCTNDFLDRSNNLKKNVQTNFNIVPMNNFQNRSNEKKFVQKILFVFFL